MLLPQPRSIEVGASIVPARIIATSTSPALPPQGYRLVADERGVTILGADPAGVSYAQATLAQLVGLYGDQIPALRIEDWPDLAIRGVMLDISRDKVPTMATLKALIARLASWKVNHVQLYMEHTFAYPGHREVWAKADPLTADEIDELDRYCRELHVELAPNQNCLGHMERWLAHPRYRPLAILPERPRTEERKYPAPRPTTLEPAHPGSLALVRELLADLLPHFGSKRVNVGLDEPWELPAERFADYVAYVRALRALEVLGGREMLMWGDILAPHPEVLDALPDGVTVCDWGYEADHPFEERAARLRAAGREFWLCPGTSSWNSLVGRWTNARLNILAAAVAAAKDGAAALLNTDWGDRGHLQYLPVSEPGFAYAAAVSWCLESNRDLDVAAALDAHAFHDGAREVGGALLRLADLYREVPAIQNRSLLTQPLYERDERVGTGSSAGLRTRPSRQWSERSRRRSRRSTTRGSGGTMVRWCSPSSVPLVRCLPTWCATPGCDSPATAPSARSRAPRASRWRASSRRSSSSTASGGLHAIGRAVYRTAPRGSSGCSGTTALVEVSADAPARLDRPGPSHLLPDEQDDHRADGRADEARGAEVERSSEEQRAERPADERADHAQDHRAQPTHRLGPGYQPARDEARDEADDQERDETHVISSESGCRQGWMQGTCRARRTGREHGLASVLAS